MNADVLLDLPTDSVPFGASPAARGSCASGPWLGWSKRAVCDLRPLEGRFGGSDPQGRP